MDWKAELVRKINELKPEDFDDEGHVDILVPLSASPDVFMSFVKSGLCVNRFPVSWVKSGHLMLMIATADTVSDDAYSGTLCFVLSRNRKFNELKALDIGDFHLPKRDSQTYKEIDLMAL